MLASSRGPRRAARSVLFACLAAVCALALGACGSSDDDAATGATSSGGDSAGVPKKKIVYAQTVGNASEIAKRESDAVKQAAGALGWDLQYIEGQGDIAKMIQGINGGINGGADAVLVASTDAAQIAPVFQLAKRKDIPVIGVGGGATPSDDFDVQYFEDETKMAELLTKQMQKDLGDKGTVAALDNSQLTAGKLRQQGREKTLEGSSIETVDRQDTDLADLIGGSKKAVSAMLTRHPDVDALWLVYDAMMPPGLEALNQRNNKTSKVYSWFANPSNLEVMRKNENVQALVDSNLDHTDLIALDQLAKHFKDGSDFDPQALENCQVKYTVVTRDNMPPDGQIQYPVEENVAPFVENWKAGKYGEGAGCA